MDHELALAEAVVYASHRGHALPQKHLFSKKKHTLTTMALHEWREFTREEGTRLFRAERFGRRWSMRTKLKADEDWTILEPPFAEAVLLSLREVLWNKYQRKKLPHDVIVEIDKMINPDATGTTLSATPPVKKS
jgi:hypothetical protein